MDMAPNIAAVIAIAVGLVAAFRWLRRAFRTLEAMHRIIDHELRPNGGGSLVDGMRKVRSDIEQIRHRFDALEDNIAARYAYADEVIAHADRRITRIEGQLNLPPEPGLPPNPVKPPNTRRREAS